MRLRCPECGKSFLASGARCPGGHVFAVEDGVLVLMSEDRREALDAYLADFADFRQGRGERIDDPGLYEDLPFSRPLRRHPVWRLRGLDARLVDRLTRGRPAGPALDLGAWNCWLSHHLAVAGHRVLAADVFSDPWDGLGARRHYRSGEWTTVRMDVNRVDLLDSTFDLIVVNRSLQMLAAPFETLDALKECLAPGGLLLITGINLIGEPSAVAAHFARLRNGFRDRYRREIGLVDFKGYLDLHDARRLRAAGVRLRPYWQLLPGTLRAFVDRTRPRYLYGVFRRPGGGST